MGQIESKSLEQAVGGKPLRTLAQPTLDRRVLCAAAGALIVAPNLAPNLARAQDAAPAKPRVAMKTGQGLVVVELEPVKAPITTANFLRYAAQGHVQGATIFRASRTQGAETTGFIEGRVQNDPAKLLPPIKHESTIQTGLSHQDGTISMARSALGTARVDFFICVGPAPYFDADPKAPGDNQGYAAFGQVVEGMDIVRAILALPTPGKAKNAAMAGQILDPPVPILGLKKLS
jgi:peptidyl-prolyl cis-trans isomerase A (cyclophilin A)